ncbi:MAG: hypothetical protein ACFFB5_24710 [Promethearchaeota archaeon]
MATYPITFNFSRITGVFIFVGIGIILYLLYWDSSRISNVRSNIDENKMWYIVIGLLDCSVVLLPYVGYAPYLYIFL